MRKTTVFYIALVFTMMLSMASTRAADFNAIDWNDLQGTMDVDDPFQKLTEEQANQLTVYSRVFDLEQFSAKRVTEAMREEKEQARVFLAEQGVDVEYLLENRKRVRALRREAASKPNLNLNGSDIEIGGFMLALDMHDGKVSEFLLVPTVGACIHTPPPPANQILLVRPKEPVESHSQFEAVRVRGNIKIQSLSSNLFLVDGEGSVDSSYILDAREVSKYSE